MADMYVKLNTSRSYLYNVARAMDNGHLASMVSFLNIKILLFFTHYYMLFITSNKC